jgi:hypothetical protein
LTPVLSERITDPASSHPHAARWAAFLLPRKEKQMQILAYLLARFSEPSSYAGLGAALALIGWNLPQPVLGDVTQALAGFCALLAFLLKERGFLDGTADHRG